MKTKMLVTKIKNDAKRLSEIETELLDAFRKCDNDEIENLKNVS